LRHEEPPRLIHSLKGDLDLIVMKALEKDRQRRYETANALALDVRRYLNDEAVLARPPSQSYRLKKLIQRNKVVYASGAAVVISMLVGLGVSTRMFILERQGRLEQSRLRQQADAARMESEQARAREARLRQEAEAREKVTQAVVLLGHGQTEEADALLAPISIDFFTPSTEASTVFRELATWNTLQGRWRQAADRYLVLMHVNHVDKADQGTGATADLLTAAPLLIEAGDLEGYERVRRLALARLSGTSDPGASEQFLKTSLLLPADPELMKALEPFARLVSNSLVTYSPRENDGRYYLASWRAMALALWEYRSQNYTGCLDWLDKCLHYQEKSISCVAGAHLLESMANHHLGRTKEAETGFNSAKAMVEDYFSKELELGNEKDGRLAGWIMNAIFLREAENLVHPVKSPTLAPD
jgi:hypothetical protein